MLISPLPCPSVPICTPLTGDKRNRELFILLAVPVAVAVPVPVEVEGRFNSELDI